LAGRSVIAEALKLAADGQAGVERRLAGAKHHAAGRPAHGFGEEALEQLCGRVGEREVRDILDIGRSDLHRDPDVAELMADARRLDRHRLPRRGRADDAGRLRGFGRQGDERYGRLRSAAKQPAERAATQRCGDDHRGPDPQEPHLRFPGL
jgi:hypothetical protein